MVNPRGGKGNRDKGKRKRVSVTSKEYTPFVLNQLEVLEESLRKTVAEMKSKATEACSSSAAPGSDDDKIIYDAEPLRSVAPQDEKDVEIMKHNLHKQRLERELQGWSDWAGQKAKEAAEKIRKDQDEMRMLRLEIEQSRKLNALQEENTMLKKGLAESKLISQQSSKNAEEAKLRAQELEKQCRTGEVEISSLQRELAALEGNSASLQAKIEIFGECKFWIQCLHLKCFLALITSKTQLVSRTCSSATEEWRRQRISQKAEAQLRREEQEDRSAMIVKRKQVAKRHAPKTRAKKVRISGPSSNGVQNIIERNMLNIIKPESSKKKEKRQKIDEEEEESANYQSMGGGEGASSASI
nr:putative E3 ubiquitin-protein ligase RF298 isoform X2 [Ipomoea batatas]